MIIVPVPGPQPQLQENELRYPPNIFDLVILRETLMYLDREDKAVILRKIKQLLRRGNGVWLIGNGGLYHALPISYGRLWEGTPGYACSRL